MRPYLETRFIIPGFSTKVALPPAIVRFKVLHLLAILEGEALAELLRHGSAGASPSRPMNLQVPKPDDLSGRVGRKAREGELNCAIAVGTSPSPRFARPSQRGRVTKRTVSLSEGLAQLQMGLAQLQMGLVQLQMVRHFILPRAARILRDTRE